MVDLEQELKMFHKEYSFLIGVLVASWNDTDIALRYVLEALSGLQNDQPLAYALLRHIGTVGVLETINDLAKDRTDPWFRDHLSRLTRYANACRQNRNLVVHARNPFYWETHIDALILEPDQRHKMQRHIPVNIDQLKECIASTMHCFDQAMATFFFLYWKDGELADESRREFDATLAPPKLLQDRLQNPPQPTPPPESSQA